LPRPCHQGVADPQLLRQPPRTPVRSPVGWLASRPAQNPCLHGRGQHRPFSSRVPRVQPRQPFLLKAMLPPAHVVPIAAKLLAHGGVRGSRLQQQNQARAPHVFSSEGPAALAGLKFSLVRGTELQSFHALGNKSLSVPISRLQDTSTYWVRVTNACGHVDSGV